MKGEILRAESGKKDRSRARILRSARWRAVWVPAWALTSAGAIGLVLSIAALTSLSGSLGTAAESAPGVFSAADRAGMAVHFTDVWLYDNVRSVDPLRGEAVYGDHWIRFDEEGDPVEALSEFRLNDGMLVQSHHLAVDGGYVEGITAGGSNDPNSVAIPQISSLETLQAMMPRVGAVSRFESRGFSEIAHSEVTIQAREGDTLNVRQTLARGPRRHFGISQDRGGGYTRQESATVDTASGVLLSSLVVGRDPSGAELYRTEFSLGVVELLDLEHSPF